MAAVLPISLALVLAGCGGSGNGNNSSSNTNAAVPLTTNQRMFKSGDSYTWNITGTETPKGGQAEALSGNRTFAVTNVSAGSGFNLVTVTDTLNLSVNGGAPTATTNTITLHQNTTDGSLVEISYTDNGNVVNVTGNTGYKTPGTFGANVQESGTLTYSNGNTETVSLNITGPDQTQINVLNTNWNSWTSVAHTSLTSNGLTTTSTVTSQLSPALGTYLTESVTETQGNGATLSETLTLNQTTVPSQQWRINPSP